ncbi:D-aminoacyl-tRNA deacylase 1 [Plodia interpunctella]|uniref:D-aminoacyl-tRNA deacylase 1 n=1 Tax=Plodia interpunctella TaxID=58824 RepID=UPI002367D736|nr:D-aminoacyl-tRNA deacylase 1 [Plodia interpunctella]
MKALIQRVMNASVTVNGEIISSIEQGVCVLIGICNNDTVKDMEYIVKKILSIKIFDDGTNKRWKKNVVESQFEVLCVSQFTLYNTWKGTKPDFHHAMPGEKSKEFYEKFLQMLRDQYKPDKIKDGEFGAYMQVCIQNDGPVTFAIESPIKEQDKSHKGDAKKSSLVNSNENVLDDCKS